MLAFLRPVMPAYNTYSDDLRRRMLNALDESEYRSEIHVGEPENLRSGGTAHTVVLRGVSVRLEFGSYICSIEVKDPEGAFGALLTHDGRRGYLVGACNLSGVRVHDTISLIKYGACWSLLIVGEDEISRFEAVFRAALELALA